MVFRNSLLAFIILFCLLFAGATAASAGAGGWYSFRQNSGNTGEAEGNGPAEPVVLWVLDGSEDGYSFDTTPAVSAETGTVYIAGIIEDEESEGALFALDLFGYYNGYTGTAPPENGANLSVAEVKWKVQTDRIRDSSPALDNGVLYFGDFNEEEIGTLHALDASSGDERWRFRTGGSLHSSPVVTNESILIGSYDSRLYSVNISDGSEEWNTTMSYWVHATPAVYNGSVFLGFCGEFLNIIDSSDGNDSWKFFCRSYVISSPAVRDDTIYFGDFDGYFYSVDAVEKTENWNLSVGGNIYSSPAVDSERVYFGSDDGYLNAVHTDNGTFAWRFKTGAEVKSSPAVAGDTVYVGSNDGFVYALDTATGGLVWKYDTGSMVKGSPAVADGLLIVATTGGKVFAFGTTNITAPAVLNAVPSNNGQTVDTTTDITIIFSTEMDRQSIELNLDVEPVIEGDFSWQDNILTITPNGTLLENTTYTLTISGNATDRTDNKLGSDYSWHFTTKPAEVPDDGNGDGNGNITDKDEDGSNNTMLIVTLIVIVVIIIIMALVITNKKKDD